MSTQTLWISPTEWITGDPTLKLSYPSVQHPAVEITATTPGDLKWVFTGLRLPAGILIKAVRVCYQLSNKKSFISQVRLTEMQAPDVALVRHDDATDLLSTDPTCYVSNVGAYRPQGAVTLALRLKFAKKTDKITLGPVGVDMETCEIDVANVKCFGAVGDGVADDSLAIEAAGNSGKPVVVPSGTYRVASNITINNDVTFAGGLLKVNPGVTVRFTRLVVAQRKQQIFSGGGYIVMSRPQVVHPDWWGDGLDIIQKAIDASAPGSRIELTGKYVSSKITIKADEPNKTGDLGKALVGVAAPGLRDLNTQQEWGAEIYLADGQNTDLLSFDGKIWYNNDIPVASAISFVLDNLRLNGNKAVIFKLTGQSLQNLKSEGVPDEVLKKLEELKDQKPEPKKKFLEILKKTIGEDHTDQFGSLILKHAAGGKNISGHGLKLEGIKDLYIGTLIIEDCAEDGLFGAGGQLNLIHGEHVECLGNDQFGFNGGSMGDSHFNYIEAGHNGSNGVQLGGGTQVDQIHSYQNKRNGVALLGWKNQLGVVRVDRNKVSGVMLNGATECAIGSIHTMLNEQHGVQIHNSDENIISAIFAKNNGRAATGDYAGVRISGDSSRNKIGHLIAKKDDNASKQQHGYDNSAAGADNVVQVYSGSGHDQEIKIGSAVSAGNRVLMINGVALVDNRIARFADQDATPSVKGGNMFETGSKTPTDVTNFDDGIFGQQIVLLGDDDGKTTVKHNANAISLSGGVDFTLTNSDTLVLLFDGMKWNEISRSHNTL